MPNVSKWLEKPDNSNNIEGSNNTSFVSYRHIKEWPRKPSLLVEDESQANRPSGCGVASIVRKETPSP